MTLRFVSELWKFIQMTVRCWQRTGVRARILMSRCSWEQRQDRELRLMRLKGSDVERVQRHGVVGEVVCPESPDRALFTDL